MNEVITIVFSDLFKREKKWYSIQDIKFLFPISFRMLRDAAVCTIIWFVPIYLIFGLDFILTRNGLIVSILPVVLMTWVISKPQVVFNNKSFYSWALCNIKYLFSPKYYTDGKSSKINNGDKMDGDFVIWIGDSHLDDDGNVINVNKGKISKVKRSKSS